MESALINNLPQAPSIFVQHAALSIGTNVVFADLNCQLISGKFTCLLGPSGIGKSTLLHMIASIIDIKQAKVSGTIIADDNLPLAQRIAYMGQTDLLLPWLSVLNNTLLGVRLRHQLDTSKKQRALQLLRKIGLGAAVDKSTAELSGGMRQRVAIARTLMEDKPIVLMDEPFSSLDAIMRLNLQNVAASWLKNKTVLLVTHDPLEALRLGDVVYVMTGRPAQLGAPIQPPGQAPRSTTNVQVLALQGELLQRLAQGQQVKQ